MGYVNERKAAIVGCGLVGSTTAFALMETGLFSEMVMIDVDRNRAEGEALDISHGTTYAAPIDIYAGDYADAADAAIIVIAAGAGQAPGETRIDLAAKNVKIFDSILSSISALDFEGIVLVISNPVDVLTYQTAKTLGIPESRVIGSGTVLDTGRLKHILGESLEVDPRNVHAQILGEHGDSEMVAWSSAHVGGIPLEDFYRMRMDGSYGQFKHDVSEMVRNSAYEIIEKKRATYYGIAMAAKRICEAIVRDEKSVLPVSHVLHDECGLDDVALSIPCIVGSNGVEMNMLPVLSDSETAQLSSSADALKSVLRKTGLS